MITYIPTLGLVLLAGILFGVSARSVQHSPVTNLACRNPVTVTLTLSSIKGSSPLLALNMACKCDEAVFGGSFIAHRIPGGLLSFHEPQPFPREYFLGQQTSQAVYRLAFR